MKKFLYTALAFCSLALASCTDPGGITEKENYDFESVHLNFNYNIGGDLASMVEVSATTTLPEGQGKATLSSENGKHTLFVSNVKCPVTFDVIYTLSPKSGISVEENKSYTYSASYDYVVIRNFSDNSHIDGSSDSWDGGSGSVKGKNLENFFNINKTSKFTFTLTHDGYVDDTPEEN